MTRFDCKKHFSEQIWKARVSRTYIYISVFRTQWVSNSLRTLFFISEICQCLQKIKKKKNRNNFLCPIGYMFYYALNTWLDHRLLELRLSTHFWLEWLPNFFDTPFEWRQAGRLFIMNFSFDFGPEILDRVEVWTLGWPGECTKIFFLFERHHNFASMRTGVIILEPAVTIWIKSSHCRDNMFVQCL